MALACGDCLDNCRYMVCTNKLSSVVDLLVHQMKVRFIAVTLILTGKIMHTNSGERYLS